MSAWRPQRREPILSVARPVPPRGFPLEEFEQRTQRVQRLMSREKLDALLLTTESEVRYFSGFHTQFWASPTRPWFLVVPRSGKPVAVIPEIGASGMAATWIDDIRTWQAPNPADDGVSLLLSLVSSLAVRHGRIGVPLGHESHLRMPAGDFRTFCDRLGAVSIADARPLLRQVMAVKSEREIDKIRHVCQMASDSFESLPLDMHHGQTEREVCRTMTLALLAGGVDSVTYLIAASGPGGYDNIIMGPSDRALSAGDVLIIDTGAVFDGYFCDFDRNYGFGPLDDGAKHAYEVVHAATEAGLSAARPGSTTSDLWSAMWRILDAGGALGNDVGRMGHGLGMQLTEWPSNRPGDDTPLVPGMVLTLEPGMMFAPGRLMVHEEDIVVREGGAELLSRRAPPEMPLIEAR